MRYLGVDYGKKRIGMAVSDEEGLIAFPHGTIERTTDAGAAKEMRMVAIERRIERIVIGLPLALDGKETLLSRAVRKFGEKLESETRRTVLFENEIFTTRMAKASGTKKETADASAAALILQSYLDKKQS